MNSQRAHAAKADPSFSAMHGLKRIICVFILSVVY